MTLYWWQARWVLLRFQLIYLLILNNYAIINLSYWNREAVMMLILLVLLWPEVVVTTYGATNDNKHAIMMTLFSVDTGPTYAWDLKWSSLITVPAYVLAPDGAWPSAVVHCSV